MSERGAFRYPRVVFFRVVPEMVVGIDHVCRYIVIEAEMDIYDNPLFHFPDQLPSVFSALGEKVNS
jgi:hypothetical protein